MLLLFCLRSLHLCRQKPNLFQKTVHFKGEIYEIFVTFYGTVGTVRLYVKAEEEPIFHMISLCVYDMAQDFLRTYISLFYHNFKLPRDLRPKSRKNLKVYLKFRKRYLLFTAIVHGYTVQYIIMCGNNQTHD